MGNDLGQNTSNHDSIKKCNPVSTPPWKSLFNFTVRRHIPALVLALIFTVISGIIVPILAILFGKIFGAFTDFGGGKISGRTLTSNVSTYAIGVVCLGGATFLSDGLYCMAWMTFGAFQAMEVRNRLFEDLLHKEVEWYETNTSGIGALLPRLQTQIRDLQMSTSQPIGFVAQNIVSTLAALGLALYYSWKLTLVAISTVPIAFFVLSFLSAAIQPQVSQQDAELTRAAKHCHAAISAIEIVKSFNAQNHEIKQYATVIKRAAACYLKQAHSNAIQMGFVRAFTLSMFVQGFWYGNHLAATEGLSFSTVTTAFWACLLATKAFEDILPQLLVLERGRNAAASLQTILDEVTKEPTLIAQNDEKAPRFCDGDIEMRAVSFAYPSRPNHIVLKTSTLFFPAGETTFLVGRSGSGKSTIADLLMRFHDPTTGEIYIDGHDIADLDMNWLRNNITLVQQKTILFNETIRRNISFGKHQHLSMSEEELEKCVEVAMLEPTLGELPQGADTSVGATGASLSGGQRQRVAIARARLRDTPVLILDESTSALDYLGRHSVMNAIRAWRSGKTTVIITHDRTQIKEDDFVYILDDGSVLREGFGQQLGMGNREALSGPMNVAGDKDWTTISTEESETIADLGKGVEYKPVIVRQGSSYQQALPSHRASVFETPVGTTTTIRQPFTMFNPLASSNARRRSSPSSASPLEEERAQAMQMSRPISRLSSYVQSADLEAVYYLQGGGSQLGRPLTMHGTQRTRIARHISLRRFSLRRQSSAISIVGQARRNSYRRTSDTNGRQRQSAVSILLTIWPTLTARYKSLLVMGFVAALTNAAGPPVFSFIFSRLMTTFFNPKQETHKALIYSLAILGVAVVDGIGCYLMHYTLETCGQMWVDTLRVEALKRVLDQPKEWFDDEKNNVGDLTACLDRNADEMRNLLGRFAGLVFIATAMIILAVIWSMIVCWKLTLVSIAAIPGLYGITKLFDATTSKWETVTSEAADEVGSILVETFSDIRTVRALTLEGYFHRKYNASTARALVLGIKRAFYCGFLFGAAESAIHFVTALTFWYGARVVATGDFSTSSILTVFSMILFSAANANAVLLFVPQIDSSLETATRLLLLVDLPIGKSHEYTGSIRPSSDVDLPILFNDLTFAYPTRKEAPALSRLALKIPAGRCTVIAGLSGSGKSTIASLILRFYSCDGFGTPSEAAFPPLTISNYSIARLSTSALREMIAIVPQTPVIFPATVADNIIYGLSLSKPYTTTDSIESAAKAAGVHDFIMTLPQGYNTPIGDGGLGVSGGQEQRIVIARALVRKPRILILDEATSALDKESAAQVRETVRRLIDDQHSTMTVVVITHAKEMMTLGDKVVVMKQGRCVEEGTFDELKWRRNGELARMLRAGGLG